MRERKKDEKKEDEDGKKRDPVVLPLANRSRRECCVGVAMRWRYLLRW
jgi:RPA family protein